MRRLAAVFVALAAVSWWAGAMRSPEPASGSSPGPSPALASPALAGSGRASPAGDAKLYSIGRHSWIHAHPSLDSARLGYLGAGAAVLRGPAPVAAPSCPDGFYPIEPRGFVCLDGSATLDPDHPVLALTRRRPRRDGLPYHYLRSRYPPPPLYGRLPSAAEQREREPDLRKRKLERSIEPPLPADPLPAAIASGALLPGLDGAPRGPARGRARRRSGFAILASYDHEGRRFGLTSELALAPLDRTRSATVSALRGAALRSAADLPIAIVTSKRARRYQGSRPRAKLPRYAVVALSGEESEHRGRVYLDTRAGDRLRADQVIAIDGFRKAPEWAERGDKWIDVSILRQTLVAYEGTRPVFATIVSTGADGLASAGDSRATIRGTFLIHTKHLTATMKSDQRGEEFELDDVPFVQYFTEGYALHGVYWHDDFGRPRSHGCINLSPHDAAWLFAWTDPEVPEHWHAALSDAGTLVHVHP